MKLETRRFTQTSRIGLAIVAALALSVGPAFAQTNDGTGDASGAPAVAAQPEQPSPVQQAHDDAESAQSALDDATSTRDQLESDGASQDQIDAANEAIARARADKEAADEAEQRADEAASQ